MDEAEEAVKWLEAQTEPPCKIERTEKCNYCFMHFSQAGVKFLHQREKHGKMDGWLK